MQELVQYIEISKIKPAEYNPRKINIKQFEELKKSIKELGFIMPVIINKRNYTIIAGHQRTRAGKELGIEKVPCVYVNDLNVGDEIKFNQLHNGAICFNEDVGECKKEDIILNTYSLINHKEFIINKTQPSFVKEICKLILKYGNVFSAVVCDNKIIMGANYIKACQQLNLRVLCYKANNINTEKYIQADYGVFTYEYLKKNTFVQGLAQMFRSVEDKKDMKSNHSSLYRSMVLPYIKKEHTILDFGCGKGAYIEDLKNKKYKAIGLEFYNNNGKSINITQGNKQIDNLINFLKTGNKFDVVVCDSVLNSIDSIKAQDSVLYQNLKI